MLLFNNSQNKNRFFQYFVIRAYIMNIEIVLNRSGVNK